MTPGDSERGVAPIDSLTHRLRRISESAESKLARDVVAIDLRALAAEVDAFLICHGTNPRHVRAIAEAVEERLSEMGESYFIEGLNEGSWVLIDCGDLAVHIFQERTRQFYRLEELWSHAPLLAVAASGE